MPIKITQPRPNGLASMATRVLAAGLAFFMQFSVELSSAAQFTEVTAAAGISYVQGPPIDPLNTPVIVGLMGGAAAGDFDGDGWVDLFVTRSNDSDILYRNLGNGLFADVTTTAFGPATINTSTNGAAWGDIDNDGDLDLYVTIVGGLHHSLYLNQGNGTFSEQAVVRGASIGNGSETLYGTGIALGDYDRDGYLDLFVGEWRQALESGPIHARLLKNLGASQPGHFEDTTHAAGVSMEISEGAQAGTTFSFSPRFADLDGDRNPDLAITSDFGTSRLFWNEGNAASMQFSDGTVTAGTNSGRNDMGSTIGDINGDGRLDWFISDVYRDTLPDSHPNGNRLFLNEGNRQFTDTTDAAGVRNGDWGWGTAMLDYDNDGDLDIALTNGFIDGDQFADDSMRLWQNDGTGQFTEIGAAAGVDDTGQGRGLLTFDYDNDGDLDVFVVNNGGQPVLLRNDGGNDNGFLRITTEGTLSNRDGVGAFITVTADINQPEEIMVWEINAGTHYLAQSEMTAHFGLGDDISSIDQVQILWPSGAQQMLFDVPANSELTLVEMVGDFNSDGIVDAGDLSTWEAGFQAQLAMPNLAGGDADDDDDVDGHDFLLWQRGFSGAQTVAQLSAFTPAVPEPSSLLLLCLAIMGYQRRSR